MKVLVCILAMIIFQNCLGQYRDFQPSKISADKSCFNRPVVDYFYQSIKEYTLEHYDYNYEDDSLTLICKCKFVMRKDSVVKAYKLMGKRDFHYWKILPDYYFFRTNRTGKIINRLNGLTTYENKVSDIDSIVIEREFKITRRDTLMRDIQKWVYDTTGRKIEHWHPEYNYDLNLYRSWESFMLGNKNYFLTKYEYPANDEVLSQSFFFIKNGDILASEKELIQRLYDEKNRVIEYRHIIDNDVIVINRLIYQDNLIVRDEFWDGDELVSLTKVLFE